MIHQISLNQPVLESNGMIKPDSYSSNIKIAKKDNITPERFGILSLTAIPGVSSRVASVIINEYKGPSNLIVNINSLDDESEIKSFIKNIRYSDRY